MKKQLNKETIIKNHHNSVLELLITFVLCMIGIILMGIYLLSQDKNMFFWFVISLLISIVLMKKLLTYYAILKKLRNDEWVVMQKNYTIKKKQLTGQSQPSYSHYLYFDCDHCGVLPFLVRKQMYNSVDQKHQFYLIIVRPHRYSKYKLIQIYDSHEWDATKLTNTAQGV